VLPDDEITLRVEDFNTFATFDGTGKSYGSTTLPNTWLGANYFRAGAFGTTRPVATSTDEFATMRWVHNLLGAKNRTGFFTEVHTDELTVGISQTGHNIATFRNRNPIPSESGVMLNFQGFRDIDPSHSIARITVNALPSSAGNLAHAGSMSFFTTGADYVLREGMRLDEKRDLSVFGNLGIGANRFIRFIPGGTEPKRVELFDGYYFGIQNAGVFLRTAANFAIHLRGTPTAGVLDPGPDGERLFHITPAGAYYRDARLATEAYAQEEYTRDVEKGWVRLPGGMIYAFGSIVKTLNVNGDATVFYSKPFPGGVTTVVVSNGDGVGVPAETVLSTRPPLARDAFAIRARPFSSGQTLRVNYVAFGY